MAIKATKDNSQWISQKEVQGQDEPSWVEHQVNVEYTPRGISIAGGTTTTTLVTPTKIHQDDKVRLCNSHGVAVGNLGAVNDEPSVNTHDIFGDGSIVATYTLDNNANDLGGTYDGVATDVTFDTGKFGQAAVFNGNSAWIDATSIPETITASQWSWSCWVYFTQNTSYETVCVNGRNLAGDNSSNDRKNGLVWVANGEIQHVAKGSDDGAEIVKSVAFSDYLQLNKWHHVVYTLDSNIHKIYIDGTEVVPLTINTTGSVELTDGVGFELFRHHYNNSTNSYAQGKRDQVRIFNRALTQQEIKTIYNELLYSADISSFGLTQAPTKAFFDQNPLIRTSIAQEGASNIKPLEVLTINSSTVTTANVTPASGRLAVGDKVILDETERTLTAVIDKADGTFDIEFDAVDTAPAKAFKIDPEDTSIILAPNSDNFDGALFIKSYKAVTKKGRELQWSAVADKGTIISKVTINLNKEE